MTRGRRVRLLRREGLYSSHLVEWRRARDTGPGGPGRQTPPGAAKRGAGRARSAASAQPAPGVRAGQAQAGVGDPGKTALRHQAWTAAADRWRGGSLPGQESAGVAGSSRSCAIRAAATATRTTTSAVSSCTSAPGARRDQVKISTGSPTLHREEPTKACTGTTRPTLADLQDKRVGCHERVWPGGRHAGAGRPDVLVGRPGTHLGDGLRATRLASDKPDDGVGEARGIVEPRVVPSARLHDEFSVREEARVLHRARRGQRNVVLTREK